MWLLSEPTYWMPPPASNHATLVDDLYYFLYWTSVISFVLIVVVAGWFVWRYRSRGDQNEKAESQADHSTILEIAWSLPVFLVGLIAFYFGAVGYIDLRSPPDDAYEIRVTAYKWAWEFAYRNGATSPDLHVPVDRPVRLVMSSDDVIHSLFIPAFRVKQDIVPGRYSDAWFEPLTAGEFQGFCTEYCGTKHSEMLFKVVVHPSGEFEQWLQEAGNILDKYPPEEAGKLLVAQKGCPQCHSVDGTNGIGPSFKGIWATQRGLVDGSNVKVDENYIRSSILNPQAQVAAGYRPVMPTFRGKLKDREIDAIIAYLKTLK